ncbi:MAG: anthranilate synthase component I [Acidobacteria bacterium]|nr:anthranilate synthase component I [Acidobacteriota bacterium]MBI3664022.1 anthranilate synthase component I [Acidobacteriota bacterium]
MIQPDFKTFCRLAREGNLVPVYDTITADLLTPVAAYLRLAHGAKYSFLLESVEGGEHVARYTFLGADPVEVFRARGMTCEVEGRSHLRWNDVNPIDFLRHRIGRYKPVRPEASGGLPPLVGGAIGYFGYGMVRLAERIPETARDDRHLDDTVLMFYLGLVAFDHVQHRVWIVRNVFTDGPGSLRSKYDAAAREIENTRRALKQPLAPQRRRKSGEALRVTSNFKKPAYLAAVRKAKQHIRAGDIFQVVLSQRFSAWVKTDPFEIYRALRVVNPSPYMYFLRLGDVAVVGSSPEMLVKVQGREAFYRPIAGTRPRGRDDAEDRRLEAELRADPKERAEHVMLVDLGRNDLGRVCEYGSVHVDEMMFVERYSHVMHIVSRLRGKLRAGVDCFDALMACFPAGTVSGAPKVRAMEIIDQLEPTRRGIYAGAILYLDFSGNLDSCIAIRTLVMKGGVASVQAGGGIVADSVPEREFQETVNKASALLAALDAAQRRKM